jgi:hypothetical protein
MFLYEILRYFMIFKLLRHSREHFFNSAMTHWKINLKKKLQYNLKQSQLKIWREKFVRKKRRIRSFRSSICMKGAKTSDK